MKVGEFDNLFLAALRADGQRRTAERAGRVKKRAGLPRLVTRGALYGGSVNSQAQPSALAGEVRWARSCTTRTLLWERDEPPEGAD